MSSSSSSHPSSHPSSPSPGTRRVRDLADDLEYFAENGKRPKNSPCTNSLHEGGRWVGRTLGTFFDVHETVVHGAYLVAHKEGEPFTEEVEGLTPEQRNTIIANFRSLLAAIPSLEDDLKSVSDDSDAVFNLIRFVDAAISTMRRDDLKTLRGLVVLWVPYLVPEGPKYFSKPLDFTDTTKSSRGFTHVAIGRLLCPMDLCKGSDHSRDRTRDLGETVARAARA
ncbi:hypothetical protein PHLGIDRAFT_502159 [Phlebiopsis gigantea 11061_1 CR5-6]|uniref:Uncharacterized protein n=1 Tax=Phlebiopsis gigantea (strain 11061_1 CR5-6) TaxID=745531 RepID=A0A0C3S096_PHLG1|nr:hypothetical protein PHLGIDRAFT_502159 [Phlebiopsis gigantea 11061_1 CR5-6]